MIQKTYVVENVLADYTSGLIVVKANDKKDALRKIKKQLSEPNGYGWDYESEEIIKNLRLLKKDELVYVTGGS